MQGIAQYTLLRKAWALRGRFCRWQKNNQRSLLLPMIIKNQNLENQNSLFFNWRFSSLPIIFSTHLFKRLFLLPIRFYIFFNKKCISLC